MRYGTSFLKNTYQNIVRIDERNNLYGIDHKKNCIVYGNNDNAVNPQKMLKTIKDSYSNVIKIIDNANHDNIITDYVDELEMILNDFLNNG